MTARPQVAPSGSDFSQISPLDILSQRLAALDVNSHTEALLPHEARPVGRRARQSPSAVSSTQTVGNEYIVETLTGPRKINPNAPSPYARRRRISSSKGRRRQARIARTRLYPIQEEAEP